jgi:AraC-like DNA-binding protein
MHETPQSLSNRPREPAPDIDVIADLLEVVRLHTVVVGRLELGAPWRLKVPRHEYLSFYIVARGNALLDVSESPGAGQAVTRQHSLMVSAGDAVLLPRGSAHVLRDATRSEGPPVQFDYQDCPRGVIGEAGAARLGGDGPVTVLIAGRFEFGTAPQSALLGSLPPAIHLPADAPTPSPQLAGVVPLILSESATPGPGSSVALGRLADLLLIQALRVWALTTGRTTCGLRALSDPAIGAALRFMHARPAEPWTVERLAAAVAMSRSAFAARFTELVGEPPLQYLARWRMAKAAQLLREREESVAAVAEQVGYANVVTFTKAFARVQGIGPGAYRRGQRANGAGTRMPVG